MFWEPLEFLLYSMIEGIGLFILMLSVYRLKFIDHLWPTLFIILIMCIQSFVMRYELELAFIVPIINLTLFALLLATVWRVPIVWSVIISITGYLAFGLIQTLIMVSIFGTVEVAKSTDINGYILQMVTGISTTILGYLLYKFGIGFTFDFERLRLKREHFILISSIALFFIFFMIVMYKNEVWLNLFFTTFGMALLLYYAIRKERGSDD
ncbi:hypothetical protein EJP82_01140 [Paenibacillus anaericanus]|uniref:Uncharacterized protein n=1 Tax=Paenibacillus anaericanus TaxID=170367 RepID=A0A3S1DT95_9BACL|nr:hypothetical protein [Paenibacillus anaericanus]RUT48576.1 hypothetical protein EJP82_01140 [Paenibacillus anaericanus]